MASTHSTIGWTWSVLSTTVFLLVFGVGARPAHGRSDPCKKDGCTVTFTGRPGACVSATRKSRKSSCLCTIKPSGSCTEVLHRGGNRTFWFSKDGYKPQRSKAKRIIEGQKVEGPFLPWYRPLCVEIPDDATVLAAVAIQGGDRHPLQQKGKKNGKGKKGKKRKKRKKEPIQKQRWCSSVSLTNTDTELTITFARHQTWKEDARTKEISGKEIPVALPLLRLRISPPDAVETLELRNAEDTLETPEPRGDELPAGVREYRLALDSGPLKVSADGYVTDELTVGPSRSHAPPIHDVTLRRPSIILVGDGAQRATLHTNENGIDTGEPYEQNGAKGRRFAGYPSGRYEVTLEAEGLISDLPQPQPIDVEGSEDKTIKSWLRRPKLRIVNTDGTSVHLRKNVPGAHWGDWIHSNPVELEVETGSYELEVRQMDRVPHEKTIDVFDDREYVVPPLVRPAHTVKIIGACQRAVLLIDGRARGEFAADELLHIGGDQPDVPAPEPLGDPHTYRAKCLGAWSDGVSESLPRDADFAITLNTVDRSAGRTKLSIADDPSALPSGDIRGQSSEPTWQKNFGGCGKAWFPSTSDYTFRLDEPDQIHLALWAQHALHVLLVTPTGGMKCFSAKGHQRTDVVVDDAIAGTYAVMIGHRSRRRQDHAYRAQISLDPVPPEVASPIVNEHAPEFETTLEGEFEATDLQYPDAPRSSISERKQCRGWGPLRSGARIELEADHAVTVLGEVLDPSRDDIVVMAKLPDGTWTCRDGDGPKASLTLSSTDAGTAHLWIGVTDPSAVDVEYRLSRREHAL